MYSIYWKSKKGNLGISILVLCLLLVVGSLCVFVNNMINDIAGDDLIQMYNSSPGNNTLAIEMMQKQQTLQPSFWNYALPTLIFFGWIAVLIGSLLIDTHPVLLAIGVIIILPSLTAAVYIANAAGEVLNDSSFVIYQSSYPLIMWLWQHWLIILIMMILTEALAIYGKSKI